MRHPMPGIDKWDCDSLLVEGFNLPSVIFPLLRSKSIVFFT
jgi:hypothetical protein